MTTRSIVLTVLALAACATVAGPATALTLEPAPATNVAATDSTGSATGSANLVCQIFAGTMSGVMYIQNPCP